MTDLSYSAYNTLETRQPGDLTVSDMLVREVANLSSGSGDWAALAANASFQSAFTAFPMASGYYYHSPSPTDLTQALTLNTWVCAPLLVPRAVTFDRIAIEVTAAVASNTIRLGMYRAVNGVPSTLLFDAGTVDASTLGVKEITINQSVQPGFYMLGAAAQGGASGATVRARSPFTLTNLDSSVRNANVTGWVSNTTVTGALPSTIPGLFVGQVSIPKVLVRVA